MKKSRFKLGDLKDIWIDGTTYYIPTTSIKKVCGMDIAELPDKRIVKWEDNRQCWEVVDRNNV